MTTYLSTKDILMATMPRSRAERLLHGGAPFETSTQEPSSTRRRYQAVGMIIRNGCFRQVTRQLRCWLSFVEQRNRRVRHQLLISVLCSAAV